MKERVLYLSHIDWNWIKQRPQFIAEQLKKHFDVTILFTFQYRKRNTLQKRSYKEEGVTPLFLIPFSGRISLLKKINKFFATMQVSRFIKKAQPQYIYLTHPFQIEFLPGYYTGKIIYDCMDDHTAMCTNNLKERISLLEKNLINRADYILVSSCNLKKELISRYGIQCEKKFELVRNGYTGEILNVQTNSSLNKKEFTLCYVGTVSQWFNFDFLVRSLEDIPNLRYKIIGPVESEHPLSDRIEYTGTIEHHKLYDAVKETDCLIMPFLLNNIVLSVDPVKLYEYINYNMNILCVRYDEIERFAPFVHFYTDYTSYKEQIEKMMKDNSLKYTADLRKAFLTESSWDARAKIIEQMIHK